MLGTELERGLREEWYAGVDVETQRAFEQILADDGRNLPVKGKRLIQRAHELIHCNHAVDFLVWKIVKEFGEVVGIHKAVSTGREWH